MCALIEAALIEATTHTVMNGLAFSEATFFLEILVGATIARWSCASERDYT